MAYSDLAASAETVREKVAYALIKQAALRIAVIADSAPDGREKTLCQQILAQPLAATQASVIVDAVLIVLDLQGKLAAQTDAELDLAITGTAWNYLIKSRV